MPRTKEEITKDVDQVKDQLNTLEEELLKCDILDTLRDNYHISTGELVR